MSNSIHMQSVCCDKIHQTPFTAPSHLDDHKAIVLKFLTNQIKLTWTTTLLVAEGWEAGGRLKIEGSYKQIAWT